MDSLLIGRQIAALRKAKGLTQSELGRRLHISFQAVSKWERGETLPDVSLLVDLANVLETTTDNLLLGGQKALTYKGKMTVADIREGIACLERFGVLIGKENPLYRQTIRGIDEGLNMDTETYPGDEHMRQALLAEAIIQNLMAGYYIDLSDVRQSLNAHFAEIVCGYAAKYGIK